MKIEIELPELEGFEYTGEYRDTNVGDYFIQDGIAVKQQDPDHADALHLLGPLAAPDLRVEPPVHEHAEGHALEELDARLFRERAVLILHELEAPAGTRRGPCQRDSRGSLQ